jgi:hypothetical protein
MGSEYERVLCFCIRKSCLNNNPFIRYFSIPSLYFSGGIQMNSTHPPPKKAPREFWIADMTEHGSYKAFQHPPNGYKCLRVIEASYAKELEDKLAILESKASQFESTLKETMRVRDAAVEALKFYASCPDKGLMEPAISGQEFAPMGERARAVLAMIDKGEK